MARCAVVNIANDVCVAIIIADVSDVPYPDTFLVDVDNMACDVGWIYDPVINDFTNPNPDPVDEETY